MAEPDKQQTGDGADSYAEAARQMANAARQMGRETMKQAASAGAQAASNASAMMVQASVEGGKAAAQAAAGGTAAGPVGAVLSAAWSLRHTLYKLLIVLCLFFLILIVLIVSLPSLMLEAVLGMNGTQGPSSGMQDSYAALSAPISALVEQGYKAAFQEVEDIIRSGGYNRKLSMEAINDLAKSESGFDAAYVLAAYSVSQEHQNTSEADMLAKLNAVTPDMFPVTFVEQEELREIPQIELPSSSGSGGNTLPPKIEKIPYVECTIHPFDQSAILAAFGIDLTHYNYFIMDGLYYTILYIRGNGYPSRVRAGWMSSLINAGEGIDVDIHLRRENRSRTIDKVAQRIRLNRTKLKGMQDTSTDYEELANSIQAGYYIKSGIANYHEDLFYLSVFLTVSAKSYEELLWRKQQMTDLLKSMDLYISECSFQQEDALKAVMPFLYPPPQLEKKAQRNVLTSGAASVYPFTSFEMSDDTGVLLGVNRYNNSLCIVDLFNTKMHKNANLNLLGTSGAGKTFTMQLLALRMRMRGIQSYIIAPIKGHEFRRACNRIGGEFIKIAPGSPSCINIMEIRHTVSPEMELIDEIDYNADGSLLAKKIQQLMIFFTLLIPDLSNEEEQMLDEALVKTYGDFGITHDNDSVYKDKTVFPPKMKQMPILGDLHRRLQENPMTARIAAIVSRFVTGSAQSFNQPTNVDLSNKYIVLDLSDLKGKLLPVGMFIALDYVWDEIKADRTKRKAIFIDEIWQLIGAGSNRMAAEFCLEIFKVIRGFGGAAISATQDLSDFFGLDDGRYGRAIINNSKNKIILNLEPDEARYVQETLKLTRTEMRAITRFERGEALVSSNNNKIPVVIRASKAETEMITTDRAELEAIVREKQKGKTHSAQNTHSAEEYAETGGEQNAADR